MINGVYSEFEVIDQRIKFNVEQTASPLSCIGTSKESTETKSVVKKCRGVEIKRKTKVIGVNLELTVHVPKDTYEKLCNMTDSDLKEGVSGYSSEHSFNTFSITQKVLDEDDVVKLKAYPNCILTEAPERSIDNNADEVAELALKIKAMRDDYGYFSYEALESELSDETKASWMNAFSSELVHNVTTA